MSLETLIEAAHFLEQQEIQNKKFRHTYKSPFGDDASLSLQATKCPPQPPPTSVVTQQLSLPPPPPPPPLIPAPHLHQSSATINSLTTIPKSTPMHHHPPHPPPAPPPSLLHKDVQHQLNANSNSYHIGNCTPGIHENNLNKTPILPTPSMVLHMNGSQTSASTCQSSFSASISTVVSSISSTTSPPSCSPMNGLTSSLTSNHNTNSSIPVTYAVESSLVAVDKDYQRRAAGTREVHNKLEKNRRAHLKECFETLRKHLPAQMEEKKASNLSILHAALKFITLLKKSEKEYEHDMEKLAREKIALQQRLNNLKKDLTAQWEHLDLTAILPPSAPGSAINESGIIIGANSSTISDHDHEAISDDSNPPISFTSLQSLNSTPSSSSSTSTQTTLSSNLISFSQHCNSLPTSISTSATTPASGHPRKSSSPPPLVPTSAALAAAAAAAAAHQQHATKDTQTTPLPPSGPLKRPSTPSTQSSSTTATLAAVSLSGRHMLPVPAHMVASAPGLAATLVSPHSFQLFGPSALRVVQTGPDSNQPVALTVATSPQGGNTTGTNTSGSRHLNNCSDLNLISSQSKTNSMVTNSKTTNSSHHPVPTHQQHITFPNGLTIPTNGVISHHHHHHHHHLSGPSKNSTAVQTTPAGAADSGTGGSAVATAVLTSATGMSTHLATSGSLAHMMATHPGLTPLVTPVAVVSQGSQVAHILAGKMMSSAPLLKPMPLVSAQYMGTSTLVKPAVVVVSTSSTLPSHSNA